MRARITLLARLISYLATLMLLLALSATLQAQTFSLPLQLTNSGVIPEIAVDGSGNIYVVWHDESNSPFANVMFTRSTDGGATFSTPAPISGIPGGDVSSPLRIVADSSGTIHVIAIGAVPTGGGHYLDGVFYARSSDGGATFSVTSITNPGETYILWAPIMTVAPSGSVNILWMPLNPSTQTGPTYTGSALSVSRSTDGGATFSRTAVWNWPNTPDTGIEANDLLVVDNEENIYVVWNYCLQSQPCTLFFSRSTDQGTTYSIAMPLGNGRPSQLLLDSAGNLDLAGKILACFSVAQRIMAQLFSAPTAPPDGNLAVDSKGDIFDLWSQSGALLLSRSTDGGATFTQINNLGNLNGGSLALDSHDNIDIPVNVTKSVGDFQIVFFRSTDGGSTFSSPTQVSNDTKMQCPQLTGMALENTGNIDVVWEQYASPYGATGVAGCDSLPTQVLFSRGVVPGFTISATPGAQTVLPGGSANFALTLTPAGGFSDAVNLTCTNLPSGATCAFNSASLTPIASGSNVTLAITTAPTLAQGNYSVTVSAASGNITQTQTVQVAVGGITSSISPTSQVIAAGASGNFTVALNSTGAFAGQLTLGCSGAPSGMACSFNPPQVTVAANGSATATLTVNVAAPPSVSIIPRPKGNWLQTVSPELPPLTAALALFAVVLSFLAFSLASVRHGRELLLGLASFAAVLVLAIGLISCGGATTTPNGSATAASTTASGSSGTGTTGASGTGTSGGTGGSGGSGGTGAASASGGTGGSGSGSGSGGSSITSQIIVQAQSGGATVTLGTISVTVP